MDMSPPAAKEYFDMMRDLMYMATPPKKEDLPRPLQIVCDQFGMLEMGSIFTYPDKFLPKWRLYKRLYLPSDGVDGSATSSAAVDDTEALAECKQDSEAEDDEAWAASRRAPGQAEVGA